MLSFEGSFFAMRGFVAIANDSMGIVVNTIRAAVCKSLCMQHGATVHFVGIGGIGMSALARILLQVGFCVQGSDVSDSNMSNELRVSGVKVFKGHSASNIQNVNLVVYSSAVNILQNPELVHATESGIPAISRGELLAVIVNSQPNICVAGAHGKTTTTAMIANAVVAAGLHPTIINGGVLCKYGTNAILGEASAGNQLMCVTETDESDGSFLLLTPTIVVITNIDAEHLDYYKNFENVIRVFQQFIANIKDGGVVIANARDNNTQNILNTIHKKKLNSGKNITVVTYELLQEMCETQRTHHGMFDSEELCFGVVHKTIDAVLGDTHVVANNVRYDSKNQQFLYDVYVWEKVRTSANKAICCDYDIAHVFRDVRLRAVGIHNVENSLAAIASLIFCDKSGRFSNLDVKAGLSGLADFAGVKRRFNYVGKFCHANVVDDYAHHPREIKVVIEAAKHLLLYQSAIGRLIVIVQPHRYTRLKALMPDFAASLLGADIIFVLDVYAAFEEPIMGVDSIALCKIISQNHQSVYYLGSGDNIAQIQNALRPHLTPNDMILCIGAGNITQIATNLCVC